MTDDIRDRLDSGTEILGALSQALSDAYHELNEAEDAWLPLFDAVAEALREESRDAGRASPPEHTLLSAARHRHPSEYGRFRKAKRDVQKLETISQNRRAEVSGLQSALKVGESTGPQTKRQSPGGVRAA